MDTTIGSTNGPILAYQSGSTTITLNCTRFMSERCITCMYCVVGNFPSYGIFFMFFYGSCRSVTLFVCIVLKTLVHQMQIFLCSPCFVSCRSTHAFLLSLSYLQLRYNNELVSLTLITLINNTYNCTISMLEENRLVGKVVNVFPPMYLFKM